MKKLAKPDQDISILQRFLHLENIILPPELIKVMWREILAKRTTIAEELSKQLHDLTKPDLEILSKPSITMLS